MGLRTISVHMRSSPALEALWTLDRAPTVGEALRRALDGELDRVREPLSLLGECLWWLAESGAFRRSRSAAKACAGWRPGRPVRAGALLEGELALDVSALAAQVECGDEAARVTSVAARNVTEALRDGSLVVAQDSRAGRTKVAIAALAKDVRAHLERAERAALRAQERVAREFARAEQADRERKAREKAARDERKESARKEHEKLAREREEREERERLERERLERESRARAKKARKKAKPTTSFGGLPDDAEPEDRSREKEQLGARGLVLDAEFFLDEAVLPWPCEARALDSARKSLLVRFHPDRAGDAGVEKFQRAMRGYHVLVRALEKLGSNTRAADHGPRVAAAHATQPPPPAPAKAREDAPAEKAAAEKRAKQPTATPAARRQAVRGAAVGEWPPRARSH